ncbi:sensory histidine kinase DcuS [compost metagenome]
MAKVRVRARAVDMLGRQQIAGIPTAINEIFKNAHDAYADRVEADYIRADGLLVIRDDGIGMTRDDFEAKWLTIGTESKVGANLAVSDHNRPLSTAPRPIMGEKGIGRLAIAAIGPQVIVITRALRPDGLKPLVASLIHWGLFEVPGIDVDRIDIPIEEIDGGSFPNRAVMERLVGRVRENVNSLGSMISIEHQQRIFADLEMALFNPSEIENSLPGLRLSGDGHGTHFYIRPTSTVLPDDIDGGTEFSASPLEKMLLGFGNTMMPNSTAPSIIAEFRDHRDDGTTHELIGGDSFFTPEEFESADHHIDGRVDEFGNFEGTVTIYGQSPKTHTIVWPSSAGRATDCGPFSLKFAYVQGMQSQSKLPAEEWVKLSSKLNRIGGLYVYRDGIRILPYGNSDYDFVNIEQRRTKSASDWFFSYRRIFGAVEISHRENSALVEKAGREGFRSNRAYREFVSILENVFQRLAIDFFRAGAQYGDDFNVTRESLSKERELLKKRERMTRERRKEFSGRLESFFEAVEKGKPSARANQIREEVVARVRTIREIPQPERLADELLKLENFARKSMDALVQTTTVTKPRDIGLTKAQQSDWIAYVRNAEKLERDVYLPLRQELDQVISDAVAETQVSLARRRRILESLNERRDRAKHDTTQLKRRIDGKIDELNKTLEAALKRSNLQFTNDLEQALAELSRTDTTDLNDAQLRTVQSELEFRMDRSTIETKEELESLYEQLTSLTQAVSRRETLDATTAALETKNDALQTQLDAYIDLAQVGMALGIVQHEFGSTVRRIRSAIRNLKPWADGTPGLGRIYADLRTGFDHLDAYLNLFNPLSRRLHRKAIDLSGHEIRQYVEEVFDERLTRNGVKLVSTVEFDQAVVRAYPSTILPCFVNLVDNAIYWITTDSESEKVIRLDADERGLLVWNGGPGISARIADRIFEFGESTKPGGRGMGLFLSKEALGKDGFDIHLLNIGESTHPLFCISRKDAGQVDDVEEVDA